MASGPYARELLLLALSLASLTSALNLGTFAGQAEASLLEQEVVGKSEYEAARLLALAKDSEENDYTCTKFRKCKLGCCGLLDDNGDGVCGLGPDFCGKGCVSSCDYKSECDPGWGMNWSNMTDCPLNVCCSDFGFCGTISDFCKRAVLSSPQCDRDQRTSDTRTIGYYEGWNYQKPCGNMEPEEIPLGHYTHINFAFALIDPTTFRLAPIDEGTASRYGRVSALKQNQDGLEVWITIGGWAMNNPGPYQTVFSHLAKSEAAQDAFLDSLISFLKMYDFDGADLDWEYPVAEDRGGISEDLNNYVNLVARLRKRLNASGKKYGLTVTLPASYWYLKGYNIVEMEPYLDWFNFMTYDIHGVWDANIQSLGPYAFAHSNLTEIQMGLELLWRNNINPARVVLGLGFYGRSFTMADPNCLDAGCEFSDVAKGGECTGTAGVLSAAEINKLVKNGAEVSFDEKAGVKIVTWDSDQWASWHDAESLKMHIDYANEHCLGGTMVWAIDLDDGTLIDALSQNIKRRKPNVVDISPVLDCFGSVVFEDDL